MDTLITRLREAAQQGDSLADDSLKRILELEEICLALEDNAEAEQRELILAKRIANLEGWNKEMYENHRIELTRLETKIANLKVNMANAEGDPE